MSEEYYVKGDAIDEEKMGGRARGETRGEEKRGGEATTK